MPKCASSWLQSEATPSRRGSHPESIDTAATYEQIPTSSLGATTRSSSGFVHCSSGTPRAVRAPSPSIRDPHPSTLSLLALALPLPLPLHTCRNVPLPLPVLTAPALPLPLPLALALALSPADSDCDATATSNAHIGRLLSAERIHGEEALSLPDAVCQTIWLDMSADEQLLYQLHACADGEPRWSLPATIASRRHTATPVKLDELKEGIQKRIHAACHNYSASAVATGGTVERRGSHEAHEAHAVSARCTELSHSFLSVLCTGGVLYHRAASGGGSCLLTNA